MKRTLWVIPVVLVATCFVMAQAPAAGASAKPQSKDELLRYMAETRDHLLKTVAGMSDAQWNFKPAPDRWSPREVFEHITVAEGALRGMAQQKLTAQADAAKKPTMNDASIVSMITDRSKKFQAPAEMRPTGRFATKQEAVAAFEKTRAETVAFAKNTPEDALRSHTADTPAGQVDIHQFLLFVAGHSARHTKQIEEDMADPNYPKK